MPRKPPSDAERAVSFTTLGMAFFRYEAAWASAVRADRELLSYEDEPPPKVIAEARKFWTAFDDERERLIRAMHDAVRPEPAPAPAGEWVAADADGQPLG